MTARDKRKTGEGAMKGWKTRRARLRLSGDEQHAVGHAQYLVDRATPGNSEVCFDYTLVRSLLGLIKRLRGEIAQ